MATTLSPTETTNRRITTITIVHKTGRPRIIDDQNNIADIRFEDLIKSMNGSEGFTDQVKIVYCKFAKNQVAKLVQNTNYAIDSKTSKEKQNGLFETTLKKNIKHLEDFKLF